ncbi:MAG: S9 family peptidase [Acidobacteria bacterium]|nr:S9 family peptidase [Acidobacteriota bacterium]
MKRKFLTKSFCVALILLLSASVFAQRTGRTAAPSRVYKPGPYRIEQYLTIKAASAPSFSPDGRRIAYLSNESGISEVWVVDLATAATHRLTDSDDNLSFVRWLGDGTGIIFGKAKGGDENTQFYWMRPDGAGIRALTNDPAVRHNFEFVSPDGKWIAYSSNKRNRQYFDSYKMDIASGKETLISQFDGNQNIEAANAAGTKFIISRDGTELSLDNNLYLVADGHETLLTPHKGAAEFYNVEFLPDGTSLLMSQNDRREFAALTQVRLGVAAPAMEPIEDARWDVSNIAVSPSGSLVVYTVNADGFSRVFTRNLATSGKPALSRFVGEARDVKLPGDGVVSGVTFNRDQTKLAFAFNSATRNSDIWTYDLKTEQLKRVTRSDTAGVNPNTFIAPQLVRYQTFDGREIPAWYYSPKPKAVDAPVASGWKQATDEDLFRPATEEIASTPKGGGKRPPLAPRPDGTVGPPIPAARGYAVIVSVHGGPEGQERPGFNPLYQYYLSKGYAILAPNVRGSTGYGKRYTHLDDVEKREDSVKDLSFAVQWLTFMGNADKDRIAVMGGSYGGYMTLAAITLYPDLWAAAVDTVGIANWETFLKNTSSYRRRQREVEYGRLDRDLEFLRSISPIGRVDKIKCPLFVIQGKNDPRVPYTEAEQIVTAVRERGGIVEYKLYNDEGHGITKLKNRLELYPLVADFLDKYLK